MPEPEAEIVAQLGNALNDAVVAHAFASAGLRGFMDQIRALPIAPENPDPKINVGAVPPNLPGARPYGVWRRSFALEQTARDGPIDRLLSQQWVVYTYAIWEEDFRCRIAVARGCAKDDVKFPLFGDLRLLRHDVVHHRGIATGRNTGKCEILSHWFQTGDPIHLRAEHLAEFVERFWSEVSARQPG